MTRILILIGLSISAVLFSQKTEFSEYDWNTFPSIQESDTVKPVNGGLITLERRITEICLNSDNVFEEIYVFHRKIRVQTHDAINTYNKIYVPVNNVINVLAIKARFISAKGKITELPKESIRQLENLDNKGDFRIFAIEGAELGGQIEYFYTLRRKFNPYGSVTVQSDEPRLNEQVIYASPDKLQYLFKPYNGFPEFTVTTDTARATHYFKAFIPYVPAISEERYATYGQNLMQYQYTLTHNNFTGNLRVYSYTQVSRNMYENVFLTTGSEDAAVKSVLKKLDLSGKSEFDQVRLIENYLKGQIVIAEGLPSTPPIDEMLKNKQATKMGMTRLLIGFMKQLNIDFEIVLSCSLAEKRFDPDFNGWNYLDDFILYFPQFNAVIIPDNPSYRIGLIPSGYQDTYGLFLHPLKFNDKLNTLSYEVKKLPADNYLRNTDTLLINLKVNTETMSLDAQIHRLFSGELASVYQSFWDLLPEERKSEVISGMFNMGSQNNIIGSYKVNNSLPEEIGVKPLIWDVNLTASSLISEAGDDILIRIGETIGEQSELYQTNKRKLPVYVGSLHSYYRRIEFEIPEGYAVSNAENLKMKVEMIHNNRVSSAFTSDYEVKGNKLIIHSHEFYSDLEYPVSEFESFRNVINAAADFNKKTILLTKK